MKILFFTGSRGEWGYIRPILEICKKEKINYEICVSNTHLLDSFGYTLNEIEKDGFKVKHKILMTLDGYNDYSTSKSLGIFIQSFSDLLYNTKPDWLILAGDRGETFAASIASSYSNVPTAHIQAGELSGNIDGLARHAIGKMCHIHFASNEDAYNRLIRLGEDKKRIFNVGATQLDDIYSKKFKNKKDTLNYFNLDSKKNIIIAIFHPVTNDQKNNILDIKITIDILNSIDSQVVWIMPNSDSGSDMVRNIVLQKRNSNINVFRNISRDYFLGLMNISNFMIGNSSAALLEAPSFKLPAINIGNRQYQRIRAKNVLDIEKLNKKKLQKAIKKILKLKNSKFYSKIKNPYGNGNSSKKILNVLKRLNNSEKILKKSLNLK